MFNNTSILQRLLSGDIFALNGILGICSSTEHRTFNKPALFLGASSCHFTPFSSIVESDATEKEKTIFENYEPDYVSWKKLRSEFSTIKNKEKQRLSYLFTQAMNSVVIPGDKHKKPLCYQLWREEILPIIEQKIHATVTKKYQGGQCADHASTVGDELLRFQDKHTFPFLPQKVSLSNAHESHEFTLINSNLPKNLREKGRDKVAEILREAHGTICDEWNEGHAAPLDDDITGIYNPFHNPGACWDLIEVKTISLYNEAYLTLPKNVKRFFYATLKEYGYDINDEKILAALDKLKKVEETQDSAEQKRNSKTQKLSNSSNSKRKRPAPRKRKSFNFLNNNNHFESQLYFFSGIMPPAMPQLPLPYTCPAIGYR